MITAVAQFGQATTCPSLNVSRDLPRIIPWSASMAQPTRHFLHPQRVRPLASFRPLASLSAWTSRPKYNSSWLIYVVCWLLIPWFVR